VTLHWSLTQERTQKGYCFRDDFFPGLICFKDDLQRCLARFVCCITDSLPRQDLDVLNSWLEWPESETLLIDGCTDLGSSDWTTDLALELLGSSNILVNLDGSKANTVALAYHFCGEKAQEKKGRPEIVIQDLLSELLETHGAKFEQSLCLAERLTRNRFLSAAKHPDELWRLFRRCLELAGIRSLLMVVDNVDSLYSECQKTPARFNEFVENLQALVRDQKGIVVKVLVTSRLPNASDCIKKFHTERLKMLRFSKAPDRRRPRALPHGVHRVPIEPPVNGG
jgi:hypothetical protein